MEDTKTLLATEARKLTEESNFLLRNCYKRIRDAASTNCNQITLGKCDYDSSVVNVTISKLKEAGYKITEINYGNYYRISW